MFTKENMFDIRSCIKRRGTKKQRKALANWERTTGYMLATRHEGLQKHNEREISRLKNILSLTRLFIQRNNLSDAYEKELTDYINNAS